MIFPSINKLWIYGLLFVGLATSVYLVDRHITLQGEKIEALTASLALSEANAKNNAEIANANSKEYLLLQEQYTITVETLNTLRQKEKEFKDKTAEETLQVKEYVSKLDKDSFEAKCYDMVVNLNGV